MIKQPYLKGITENERLTYYDLPQELSEKAIQKLASPRIMAIRPGGKILIRHVAAVPKSLRHIITLPIIDAWIQEFAAHMGIRQNRSGRQVCPN